MSACRKRIVEIIQRSQISNVPEISRILGISKPAVQYHIQNLLQEEQIQEVTMEKSISVRGRPIKNYRIAENHQPDNFSALADILLTRYLDVSSNIQNPDEKLLGLARSIAGISVNAQSFIRRMGHCMTRLGLFGYQPHWEVARHGSQITLRNCPYVRILPSHPELCRMDHFLLESILDLPVHVISLSKDHPGLRTSCEFFFSR